MKSNFPSIIYRTFALSLALFIFGCADNAKLIQEQENTKKELAEIKKMLAERPATPQPPQAKPFQPVDVNIADAPFLGKADAPVTLVEFTDYRCPFCKRHATTTKLQLVKEYVDTGKLKYVLKEFPLKSLHPDADKLSLAALCAGDQGKYWEMHDAIFSSESKPDPKDLSKEIASIKLNKGSFQKCFDSNKYSEKINSNISEGSSLGITGTPSFVLGKTDSADSSKVHVTVAVKGARPFPAFKEEIDKLLK